MLLVGTLEVSFKNTVFQVDVYTYLPMYVFEKFSIVRFRLR